MHKIVFQIEGGENVSIFAASGENLLDLARKANVAIDAPCSGNSLCGKCKIRLTSGALASPKSHLLDDSSFAKGWRLACASTVCGDAIVAVPDIADAYRNSIKTADLSSPEELVVFNSLQAAMEKGGLKRESRIQSFLARMESPTLSDTMPDNERLVRALCATTGEERATLPYAALKNLPVLLRDNEFELRCIAEKRGDTLEIIDLLPKEDAVPVCGLAIDIGTTTVSGLLIDVETGKILAKASAGNGQIRYGADVINRIIEQQKERGIDRLQDAIIKETLLPLIDCMCQSAGIKKERIYRMAVASNTTMNHLLLGVNANPLRTEPYIPAFFHADPLFAKDLGIQLAPNARLHLAPNIGSYVGGDITAGALASMMWNNPELSMLIDLGTNGEIVFGNNEFLMACACSAGPAFEGGNISCGMRATDGAIEACVIDKDSMQPKLSVIGGGLPVGLCGSGIIDAIGELFRTGIIDGKGKFIREGKRINFDEFGIGSFVLAYADETAAGRDISINDVDIDSFIRAKGAIFSAIMTLLDLVGCSIVDIRHIAVAGGIGSGINIQNAIRIGMLPSLPIAKYRYIGNSSLAGAYAMLVSETAASRLHELAQSMTYIELSAQPGYMDAFVAACFLPHTDAALFTGRG